MNKLDALIIKVLVERQIAGDEIDGEDLFAEVCRRTDWTRKSVGFAFDRLHKEGILKSDKSSITLVTAETF